MYLKHLSSLQFLTYLTFLAITVGVVARLLPGQAPPVRREPYSEEELSAHDGKLAKYFLAGGAFLALGSVHMALKNLPWLAEWEARAGYAGHLVRDLSNTHVMIVGGGTLIATGACWYVLPRIVRRPLASGRWVMRGSTYQQMPVAISVPPPTIITCVLERSRTRWPA